MNFIKFGNDLINLDNVFQIAKCNEFDNDQVIGIVVIGQAITNCLSFSNDKRRDEAFDMLTEKLVISREVKS